METIYPNNSGEWAALLAAIVPLFIWALSSVGAALSAWRRAGSDRAERYAKDWVRIGELMNLMHNGARNGLWVQQTAIEEFRRFRRQRQELVPILKSAQTYWAPANAALAGTLQSVISDLEAGRRWFY